MQFPLVVVDPAICGGRFSGTSRSFYKKTLVNWARAVTAKA
jgi:hypothetical protein